MRANRQSNKILKSIGFSRQQIAWVFRVCKIARGLDKCPDQGPEKHARSNSTECLSFATAKGCGWNRRDPNRRMGLGGLRRSVTLDACYQTSFSSNCPNGYGLYRTASKSQNGLSQLRTNSEGPSTNTTSELSVEQLPRLLSQSRIIEIEEEDFPTGSLKEVADDFSIKGRLSAVYADPSMDTFWLLEEATGMYYAFVPVLWRLQRIGDSLLAAAARFLDGDNLEEMPSRSEGNESRRHPLSTPDRSEDWENDSEEVFEDDFVL